MPGFEPGASYMRSKRSTAELHPLSMTDKPHKIVWLNCEKLSSIYFIFIFQQMNKSIIHHVLLNFQLLFHKIDESTVWGKQSHRSSYFSISLATHHQNRYFFPIMCQI